MDTMIDLGRTKAFRCGDLMIDPAARQIRGPARNVMLEPRVMQLLVALHQADGAVVARDRLVARCWGTVFVGDDSLNRAVAGLRRGLKDAGSRGVEVITVPKVGYRLAADDGPGVVAAADMAVSVQPDPAMTASRRRLLGGLAAVAAAGLAGTGARLGMRKTPMAAGTADLARAEELLLTDRHGAEGEARALLERMVATVPGDARAWGLLAVAWQQIADSTLAETLAEAERQVREAARRALALDRLQGDAQAALALLDPSFGAWMVADERLQRVLEVAPENVFAGEGLLNLLLEGGRLGEAQRLVPSLFAAHPESAVIRTNRVLLAWAGDGPEAALRLAMEEGTPDLRVAVMPWLMALSGRHVEAEALIAGIEARQRVPSRVLRAQRLTARALGSGAADARAAAREALLPLGTIGGFANDMAIGGLAGLGYLDDAYALAERWYLSALMGGETAEGRARRHATGTRILFLPITQTMRADPRFVPLCERIGLVAYWRQRGLRADALKTVLLPL